MARGDPPSTPSGRSCCVAGGGGRVCQPMEKVTITCNAALNVKQAYIYVCYIYFYIYICVYVCVYTNVCIYTCIDMCVYVLDIL